MKLKLLPAIIIAIMATSCADSGSKNPVPRRTAYPRVQLYDSAYVDLPKLPVTFPINSSASAMINHVNPGHYWINIKYPKYGATVRLTLQMIPPDSIRASLSNRMERAALNIGGRASEVTELTSFSGITSNIMLTPAAAVTPIHWFATDNATFLLTGAAEFNEGDVEANAPAVNAIYSDLLHASKNLATTGN